MTALTQQAHNSVPPMVGMMAAVRNRRGVVSAVAPFGGEAEARLHLVTVEYTDPDGPPVDVLVWEREPGASLLEPTALPDVFGQPPMLPEELDGLVRATRWTAMSPFVDPDGEGPLTRFPMSSPFHAAIQLEDYQLIPLLKALRMPRVTLLLADDVGLGKTIQAGLILVELIQRRRLRRVLVMCPASLRSQWAQEMTDKFSLPFEVVDREATYRLRKEMGMDANPWRAFPRVITSYDYLKQPDVLETFQAACAVVPGSPHLPWDMLVVDEAHNLAPVGYGGESQVSHMLAMLAPYFEHRLFLTATPHSGFTRSFTGLLETLDPVRFSRTHDMSPAMRARVEDVLVRRLKREINARTTPPRFGRREVRAVPIHLAPEEQRLAAAFADLRDGVHRAMADQARGSQLAGGFAVEVLGKRLLSCPVAFADSWWRFRAGQAETEAAEEAEVRAAEKALREDTDDDLESEGRLAHAARTVGAWLQPLAPRVSSEIAAVETVLADLGLGQPAEGTKAPLPPPLHDARYEAFKGLIKLYLRHRKAWRNDERLVVFTEYKTTLDYLVRRLVADYPDPGAIRVLFGGMPPAERDEVKAAFNDPEDPVRVLLATDAASEGLNLQQTARMVLHYDVPWNPTRLDQRNGRLDRHGQARDVLVFHFASNDDADLQFLEYVVGKVERIREDLGAMGDVFDQAFQQRFVAGADAKAVQAMVDAAVAAAGREGDVPRDDTVDPSDVTGEAEAERLAALRAAVDLDPDTLRATLDLALGLRAGRPRLDAPDERGRSRLLPPVPSDWQEVVDHSLRLDGRGGPGPVPALVFDAERLVEQVSGRPVFRPRRDTALVHLGHPLYQRALAEFARRRFPGPGAASRWTVRRGPVPAGAAALVVLTVEELAVNQLRETFHHWVRTIRLPVRAGSLAEPLPPVSPKEDRAGTASPTPGDVARARELWADVAGDVRAVVADQRARLTAELTAALARERDVETERVRSRYQSRQGELSELIQAQTLTTLEREIREIQEKRRQVPLWEAERYMDELARSEQERRLELERRERHVTELRAQLEQERERVMSRVLPLRYALHGGAQVFPLGVEVRLAVVGRTSGAP